MNKSTSSLIAFLMLSSVAATAAAADCARDLEQIEPKVAAINDERTMDSAKRAISLAFQASKEGNEQICRQLLSEAKKTAGIRNAG